MFVWVLLFRKLVATTLIGTYTPRVLVIDGYLYTPKFTVWIVHAILLYCVFLYGIQTPVSVLV